MVDVQRCPQCGNTLIQGHKMDCTATQQAYKESEGPCPACGSLDRNSAGYLTCECSNKGKQPFQACWIVHCPLAHPIWKSYAIVLYDLTTPMLGQPDPVLYAAGVTHEFMVYALDPAHEPYPLGEIPSHAFADEKIIMKTLSPPNYAYQFAARNDEAAKKRIQQLHDKIANGKLNPDTDARVYWEALLADAVSLRKGDLPDTKNGH